MMELAAIAAIGETNLEYAILRGAVRWLVRRSGAARGLAIYEDADQFASPTRPTAINKYDNCGGTGADKLNSNWGGNVLVIGISARTGSIRRSSVRAIRVGPELWGAPEARH